MREPPHLADESIIEIVRSNYDIFIARLTFLPIGNDSASWVYRAEAADGQTFFLKLRKSSGFRVPSLVVPRYLFDQGVPHIFSPLLTRNETFWVGVNDFALTLYPFIKGQTGTDIGLSNAQWREFGALMRQIHNIPLSLELSTIVPRETFTPNRRHLIDELQTRVRAENFANDAERELAAFWNAHRDEIRAVVARCDALARRMREEPAPFVLCHADMHPWNILVNAAGDFWLVDWDETMLARKERDLMFVIGGMGGDGVGPLQTAYFLDGYGDSAIDERGLVYYRYAWAVQDMASNAESVFLLPDLSLAARLYAVEGFMSLFAPGNIVAIATGSDIGGSPETRRPF